MSALRRAKMAAIKAAIEATADRQGVVTPSKVVEAARDVMSPLHAEFEWDDSVAAHEHRLATARELIRDIRYEAYDVSSGLVRSISYVHKPGPTQGYIPLSRAAKNARMAKEIMLAEMARCESAVGRAREVANELGLCDELDRLLAELIGIREKVQRSSRVRSRAVIENRPSV